MSMEAEQDAEPRRRGGPFKFFSEVRAEGRKVTWATLKETQISTIMVVIFGITAAVFFFLVDSILRFLVGWLLNL
jgi:preprotein translocase subunit SecE